MRKLRAVLVVGFVAFSLWTPTAPSAATTKASKTDLVLTQRDSRDPAGSGEAYAYVLEVSNPGKAARNIVLVDELPDAMQLADVASTQASCAFDAAAHRVRCTAPSLATGGSMIVTVTGSVATATDRIVQNRAWVWSDKPDASPSDNTSTEATDIVAPRADLAVVKTDAPDPSPAGGVLTYTITARNNGPATARNGVVVDDLPTTVTFLEASSSSGSCSHDAGIVRCLVGDLAVDALVTVTISVSPNEIGTIKNQVSITSDTVDPLPANNTDTESTTVSAPGPQADLQLTASGPAAAAAGDTELTYVVELVSSGPQDAEDLVLDITLSPGLTMTGFFPDGVGPMTCPTITPTHAQCVGTAGWGPEHHVTFTLKVDASAPGDQAVTATVSSATADPNPADNGAAVATTVAPAQADLQLTASGPAAATAGDTDLTYVVELVSTGPQDAEDLVLDITLSPGLTMTGFFPDGVGPMTCPTITPTQAQCVGTDGWGPEHHVTFTLKVDASAPGDQAVSATVSSATADPNPADNSAAVATAVAAAQADLQLTASGPAAATAGDAELTYVVELVSTGPQDAEDLVLDITLSPGLTMTGFFPDGVGPMTCPTITPTQAQCVGTDGWGPEHHVTFTLKVNASAPGDQAVTATVSSATADPNPADNGAAVATTVAPAQADLQLTATGPAAAAAGDTELTYVVELVSTGPQDAEDLVLDITLSPGLTMTGFFPDGVGPMTCPTITPTHVQCVGTAGWGPEHHVTFTLKVNASAPGDQAVTATVSSATADPDPADNSAAVATAVAAV